MVMLEKEGVTMTTRWDSEQHENVVRALLRSIGNQSADVPMDMFTLQMMMELVEELVLPNPITDGRTCTKAGS